MNAIAAIVEGIVAAIIVGVFVWSWKRWRGREIAITDPAENGELSPAEKRGAVEAYPVSGTLKRLPKDHTIWLLVIDETRKKIWPQGFEPVMHDPIKGNWKGYVTAFGWRNVTITAVVAPMTSQEYFRYFQRVGPKTNFEPISEVPPECKQRATIHVRVPMAQTPHPPAPIAKA